MQKFYVTISGQGRQDFNVFPIKFALFFAKVHTNMFVILNIIRIYQLPD